MRTGTLGSERISKAAWYYCGGFRNSHCWRRMVGASWQYYYRHD